MSDPIADALVNDLTKSLCGDWDGNVEFDDLHVRMVHDAINRAREDARHRMSEGLKHFACRFLAGGTSGEVAQTLLAIADGRSHKAWIGSRLKVVEVTPGKPDR